MKTDEELALGIQNGQQADLSPLIERHYHALKGFVYRMTNGDELLSQDMVQEAFLRMIHNIHHYTYPRPFKPWLYAITANLVRNHYQRADTRRAHALTADAWEQMPDADQAPEAHLAAADEGRAVSRALASLPYPLREVITLRYVQELSLAEIAAALDIPLGTVKSRLNTGLKRLRQAVEATL